MKREAVLLTIQIFSALFSANVAESINPADLNFHCNLVRELYQDLRWIRLKTGDHLRTYDGLLTCHSSTVTLKSNLAFTPHIAWKTQKGAYWAQIEPESLYTIRLEVTPETGQPEIDIEILGVTGEAFYSSDRDIIRKYGLLSANPKNQQKVLTEKQRMMDDLKSIGWERLKAGQFLGPWDMVRTDENSRVEIEIHKEGMSTATSPETDVKGSEQQPLLKKRFPSNSYFIMHPEFYVKAKVNKVIGKAWIARDREQVQKFWEKHHISLNLGPMDRAGYLQWLEDLRKPELK